MSAFEQTVVLAGIGYLGLGWYLFILHSKVPRPLQLAYTWIWPLHWLFLDWMDRRVWTLDGRLVTDPIFTMILVPMILLWAVSIWLKVAGS